MRKVKIKRNIFGDTRTAKSVPAFPTFNDSNRMHRDDVESMMFELAAELKNRGANHDYTKIYEPHRSLFYRELCAKIVGSLQGIDQKLGRIAKYLQIIAETKADQLTVLGEPEETEDDTD